MELISWFAAILSATGFFMTTSRRMDFRRMGFFLSFVGSCAWICIIPMPAFFALSCIYAVMAIVGMANNWTWRK